MSYQLNKDGISFYVVLVVPELLDAPVVIKVVAMVTETKVAVMVKAAVEAKAIVKAVKAVVAEKVVVVKVAEVMDRERHGPCLHHGESAVCDT